MAYTLGQAAKAVGKSKSTISKAIRTGKISSTLDAHGQHQIDPSELFRVWKPQKITTVEETVSSEHQENGVNTDLLIKVGRFESRIEALEEQNHMLKEERNDLRRRLDQSEEERRKTQTQLTALLTDQRQKETTKGLWERLFRG